MGLSVPSGLSLARALSPLVTWELSVWISVCLTGYKQGTALDSHTPGSSSHSTAVPAVGVYARLCVVSVPLCITSLRLLHTTALHPAKIEATHTSKRADTIVLFTPLIYAFLLFSVFILIFDPSLLLLPAHIFISLYFFTACNSLISVVFYSLMHLLICCQVQCNLHQTALELLWSLRKS